LWEFGGATRREPAQTAAKPRANPPTILSTRRQPRPARHHSHQNRSFKAFRLLARASRRDPLTGADLVVAQAESEPFKVTTKKGYDGCRKAEYLNAREVG
jgi:hypothetical protein